MHLWNFEAGLCKIMFWNAIFTHQGINQRSEDDCSWQQASWVLTAEPTLCPRDMELPRSLVHKMYIMIVLADALCLCNIQVLLWNFNLLKSFRKTRNQAVMITTLMNQESPCCCQTSCLWLDNGQCVSVCAQNVSGMVSEQSRVEGTRYRCPWGQSPPAHSAQTRRLHLQPVHSPPVPFSLSSPGQIWSSEGCSLWWEREGATTGDWREDGREEFGGKLLGPINPSELCFPHSPSLGQLQRSVWATGGSSLPRHFTLTSYN